MKSIVAHRTISPLAIALLVATPAFAVPPEEPDFPFVQESDEDDYFIHFTDQGSHALSILQAQQAADAIARNGNPTPGNPKGYHDGYVALGFSEPYFSGDRDVFYWDCKVIGDPEEKGCDNGQAYAARINMPTSVYSALVNVDGSSKSEQCNRIVLGHELFHHVEYGYVFDASDGDSAGCGPWPAAACEGHARMLQDQIYTDVDVAISGGCLATQGTAANYLSEPFDTLWEYSYDTALFWKYLAQRFGDNQTEPTAGADFLVQWWENAIDDYDTPDIIQLTRETIQDFGGTGVDSAFHDFTIANLAKDYDLSALSATEEEIWSYKDEEQGFMQDDYGSVTIFFDPEISPGNPSSSGVGPDQYGVVYVQARVGDCPIGSVMRFTAEQDETELALMSLLVIRGDEVIDVHKKVGTGWNISRTQPLPRYSRLIAPVAGLSDDLSVHTEFRCSNSQTEFPITGKPHPTHGGEVNDLAILPVDVDVFDPDGPIPGLQAEDFAVSIGDPPAEIATPVRGVMEGAGSYRLLVEIPAAVGAGRYPIHLHVGSSEASADDVILRGPRLPDQIVLLDRSSSMGQSAGTQSRLDTTRRVASFYASLLEEGIGAGIGSMANDGDDDAAIEISLGLTDDTHRAALRTAITAIGPPQGSTPIGDALALAARDFVANGAANQERHVLLLSDGGQGGGANYDAVRTELLDSGAHVHAIALGEDADQGLLQEIAYETSGSYEFVPVPIPSLGFANALADATARVAERAAGRARVAEFQGAITPSAPLFTTTFTIAETGLHDAVLAFHWENPATNLNLVVTRPGGATVQDGVGGDRVFHEATHVVQQLATLEPGTWQIQATSLAGQPVFVGSASARTGDGAYHITSVQHRSTPPPVSGRAGAFAAQLPVAIATALHDASGPIANASVEIELALPEVDDEVLVAFDHGEVDDDRAGDGVYTALFHATNGFSATGLPDEIGNGSPGSYRVRVLASGTDNSGHAFRRISESAFWVGLGDAVDSDGDGMLDRYEALHACLAIGSNDDANDSDGDHLGASLEQQIGTDPCRSDTDRGGENDTSEIVRGANPFDPGDDLLPAPGYFALVTRISEHVDDDPRFVPRPLANLLRIPSAPDYATVEIERRGSPTAPWLPLASVDPRALGGAYADEGLPEGVTFAYRMRGVDAAGNESAVSRVVEATVKQDPLAPIGALRIDTPAPRTDSSAVATLIDLYADAELGTEMHLVWADDPARSWQPFASHVTVPVEPVETPTLRTLVVQLRDAAGNESLRYADAILVYPPNSLGSVQGTVQRREGGAPGGVVVQLPGLPGDGPIVTAPDGSFELVDLAPGSYDLAFFDGEHTTTLQDVGVVAGSATQLGTLLIPEPNALMLGAAALLALRVVVRRRSAC